ncbi:DUF1631 domain-containing protein [Aquisalimonas asiatica]|uniref:Thymidine phosphorylase n=1 Tax=Aquisalimonas asiatica TaxID=406100 RepID=A0A1H8SSR6_9GAMM|nr:DUF1631 domain-containing protein [Aquisalimonas asiatica]SEO81691.1 Protein of unknown function [Aquisalimonas asiatica]
MSSDRKVVNLGQSAARGRETALYARFRALADARLAALLRHMLDHTDDALFERAEKAGSNQEQRLFFEAMREVRRGRQDFEARFLKGLADAHAGAPMPGRHGAESESSAPDVLSLVDDQDLEERLAIDGMISKARARSSEALAHLCERLDADAGREWATAATNPVDPARICATLEQAAAALHMDIQPRLIVYKLFDRYVMGHLGGLYQELNQLFIDAGVRPQIRPQGARPADQGHARAPRAPSTNAPRAGGLPDRDADEAFAVLQNLLAAGRDTGEWSGTGYAAPETTANVTDVLQALSGLQGQAPAADPADGDTVVSLRPAVLKQRVRQQLTTSAGGAADLGQAEDDTIDIVSLLFDAVLDDPNLPDSIKALLARLQIPVLKVALLDRAFFTRRDHPARRLINEMARAGVGWTDSGRPGGDPLYQAIDGIVTRLLDEFIDDVAVFDNALQAFRQYLEDDCARARQIEERTRQAAEGKARVDTAKEHVDAALRERVGQRQLAECAHRLLYEGWSQVLFISLLREGADSDGWRHKLSVVDRLLWSLDPKPDHASRKQLVTEIPPLLHDLRSELNAVMFNPIEMTKLFKALEHEHIQTLSRGRDQTQALSEPVQQASEQADTAEPQEARPEDADELAPYRERLNQVAVGTWFEFRQDSGKHLRAKLSARLSGGERLIFVNRAGFKLADRRRDELADALRRETVLMLDDNMLFDKALENVVSNLRAMRDAR